MKYVYILLLFTTSACLKNESEIQLGYNPFDEEYTSSIAVVENVEMNALVPPDGNSRYEFKLTYRLKPEVYDYIKRAETEIERGVFAIRLFSGNSLFPIRGEYDFTTSTYDYNLAAIEYGNLEENKSYTYTRYFFSIPSQICANFILEYLGTTTPERHDFCWEF